MLTVAALLFAAVAAVVLVSRPCLNKKQLTEVLKAGRSPYRCTYMANVDFNLHVCIATILVRASTLYGATMIKGFVPVPGPDLATPALRLSFMLRRRRDSLVVVEGLIRCTWDLVLF